MDGEIQRSEILGTVHEFETKASARKEAADRLKKINERSAGITIAGLCDHLKLEWEKPKDIRPKAAKTYLGFMKGLRADWGEWRVDDMVKDTLPIENWVNDYEVLAKHGKPADQPARRPNATSRRSPTSSSSTR
jgi:hypothetical protein